MAKSEGGSGYTFKFIISDAYKKGRWKDGMYAESLNLIKANN